MKNDLHVIFSKLAAIAAAVAVATSVAMVLHILSDGGRENNQQAMNMSKFNVEVQQIKNEHIEINKQRTDQVL